MDPHIPLSDVIKILYRYILEREADEPDIKSQNEQYEANDNIFDIAKNIANSEEAQLRRLERDKSLMRRVFADFVCTAQEKKQEEFATLFERLTRANILNVSGIQRESLLHYLSTGGSLYRLIETFTASEKSKENAYG